MSAPAARVAFIVFHAVLGGALLLTSHDALFHAVHDHGVGHLALVSGVEMAGALLLLIPRTVRLGGTALLLVLVPGFVHQLTRGEWALESLVYAAGVWLVMAHGPAWGRQAVRV